MKLVGVCALVIVGVYTGATGRKDSSTNWKYDAHKEISQLKSNPEIFSSFTTHGNSVYFGTTTGETYSLNDQTGKLKWKHLAYDYSIYPAAFDTEGLMYLSNFDGRIYAINSETGIEKWRLSLTDYFRIDTKPVVSDGMVFAGSRDGTFYALDQKDGSIKWTFRESPINTSYHVSDATIIHFGLFVLDDTSVYINSASDKKIYALDKKTGKQLWIIDKQEFIFQEPTIFEESMSFWDAQNAYHLINKKTGKTIYSAVGMEDTIIEGKSCIFVSDSAGTVDCINTSSGTRSWSFKSEDPTLKLLITIEDDKLLVLHKNVQSDILTLLGGKDGSIIWSQSFAQNQNYSIFYGDGTIFAVGTNMQCALKNTGEILWCSVMNKDVFKSFHTRDGIFLITGTEANAQIVYIDSKKGHTKWTHKTKNFKNASIQIHKNNLYFTTKESSSIVMLNAKFAKKTIKDSDIQSARSIQSIYAWMQDSVLPMLRSIPYFKMLFRIRNPMQVSVQQNIIDVHGMFELNILLDESIYKNKFTDADVTVTFTDPIGKPYVVHPFYYDKGLWKARFSPQKKGLWKWKISNNDSLIKTTQGGSFLAIQSKKMGFISLSKTDTRLFIDQSNNIVTPIGIQTCVYDLNQDGDPTNQWPLNTETSVTSVDASFPTTTMEHFISEHEEAGFNFFRWGDNNCSFSLWRFLSKEGNSYMVNEGTYLDRVFRELRAHKQHIWMSLLSFDYPFDKSLPMAHQKEILKKYIDYVVARYAGYVDVWEIANEIHLDTSLLQYAASYLRSIDPYAHPITTSWERPDLKEIEIVSSHWYPGECNEYCHEELRRQFAPFDKFSKPVVITEQGNLYNSWDEYSGDRYRVRLWVGFFQKIYLILWGMPNKSFEHKEGPSNIYVGPIERAYTQIFSKTVSDVGKSLSTHKATSTNVRDAVYAARSEKIIYGYIVRKIINPPAKISVISLELPGSGTIEWIDPVTGSILKKETTTPGKNVLTTPIFSTDIVFKIIET